MKPSKEVKAYICGRCKRLRSTRNQADKCCLCACGAKKKDWSYFCDACAHRNRLRRARADVKRSKAALAAHETSLAALLAGATTHPRER